MSVGELTPTLPDRVARGLIPLVALAYPGFGQGWDEDAAGVRLLAERVPDLMVADSCDKDVGLYRERVGAPFMAAASPRETGRALELQATGASVLELGRKIGQDMPVTTLLIDLCAHRAARRGPVET